jgi:hypothetical protein
LAPDRRVRLPPNCSRKVARVALFDGRPEGEPKACGGGVTAKALKAWPQLLNAVGRTINELDLYSPSSKRLHLALDEPFAIYSRVVLIVTCATALVTPARTSFPKRSRQEKRREPTTGWRLKSDNGTNGPARFW